MPSLWLRRGTIVRPSGNPPWPQSGVLPPHSKAAERRQNVAHSASCGFPAPKLPIPGRGDRLHRVLPPHPGLVHFSNATPRLTPWAALCRASGAEHRSLVVRPAFRPSSPNNWNVAAPGCHSGVAGAKRLGVRAACRRFFATPRRFKPKRQLTPRARPKRQLRSAPPPRSTTLPRLTGPPVRPGSPSPDGRVRPR